MSVYARGEGAALRRLEVNVLGPPKNQTAHSTKPITVADL
jgi:hypothetical protein